MIQYSVSNQKKIYMFSLKFFITLAVLSVLGSAYLLPPVARFAAPLTYLVAPADTLKDVAKSTEGFSIGSAFDKLAEGANSAATSAVDSVKGLTDVSFIYS